MKSPGKSEIFSDISPSYYEGKYIYIPLLKSRQKFRVLPIFPLCFSLVKRWRFYHVFSTFSPRKKRIVIFQRDLRRCAALALKLETRCSARERRHQRISADQRRMSQALSSRRRHTQRSNCVQTTLTCKRSTPLSVGCPARKPLRHSSTQVSASISLYQICVCSHSNSNAFLSPNESYYGEHVRTHLPTYAHWRQIFPEEGSKYTSTPLSMMRSTSKVKAEEKENRWTIGRGRKDSKEEEKRRRQRKPPCYVSRKV